MSAAVKAVLAVLAVVALVAVTVGLAVLVDPNRFRPWLAQAASEGIGFPVTIDGDLRVHLGREIRLSLRDVRVADGRAEIGRASEVIVGIPTRPLLRGKVLVRHLMLQDPRIDVVRDRDGRVNVVPPEPPREDPDEPTRMRIVANGGTVHFHDLMTESVYVARGVAIELAPFVLDVPQTDVDALDRLAVNGRIAIAELDTPALPVRDVELAVAGQAGTFGVELVRLALFGGTARGQASVALTGGERRHRVAIDLMAFDVGEVFDLLGADLVEDDDFDARGDLNFAVDLALSGTSVPELLASMNGAAWLQGRDLIVEGTDIDEQLSRYETLTDFGVADVGALFFAGPLGLLIARGQELAGLFESPGEQTRIQALHAHWDLTDGVAHARDVALATESNRIALAGALDFPRRRFADVTVAVVDGDGCVLLEQSVEGTFDEPDVDPPTLPELLAEATFELLQDALELLAGEDCDVFYDGALPHPD